MNNHYEYWLKTYTDYEDQILWELSDACKLLAGYIPYCDDNKNLNIELIPKTQKHIVNMKNILSEFNNDDKNNVRVVPYEFEHIKRQYAYSYPKEPLITAAKRSPITVPKRPLITIAKKPLPILNQAVAFVFIITDYPTTKVSKRVTYA